jgi:hypothetical protein
MAQQSWTDPSYLTTLKVVHPDELHDAINAYESAYSQSVTSFADAPVSVATRNDGDLWEDMQEALDTLRFAHDAGCFDAWTEAHGYIFGSTAGVDGGDPLIEEIRDNMNWLQQRCIDCHTCDTFACTCNDACDGYVCDCDSSCDGYSACSCNSACYGYSSCSSCNTTCYADAKSSCSPCNNACYGYSACSCNSACHGYTACTCNNTCNSETPCTCDMTCFEDTCTRCNATDYEYPWT